MPKDTFFNLPKEKRERVIEGAKRVFSRNHYKNVTIDAIVNEAGIPKGSFYQYFSNKDDLFKFMFGEIGIEKESVLVDELEQSLNLPFSEMITRMIGRASQFENQDEIMIGLKDRFLSECPQEVKNEILADLIPTTMKLFERVIKIYVGNGQFRSDFNIKTASFIITAVVINIDKYTLEDESDHGEVLLNTINILQKGLKS